MSDDFERAIEPALRGDCERAMESVFRSIIDTGGGTAEPMLAQ